MQIDPNKKRKTEIHGKIEKEKVSFEYFVSKYWRLLKNEIGNYIHTINRNGVEVRKKTFHTVL